MNVKELIRPSLKRLGFTFAIAVLLAVIALTTIPFISSGFNELDLKRKILDVIVNAIIFSIVIYPWCCIILELFNKKRK